MYTMAVAVPRTSVVLIKTTSRPICQRETFASVGQSATPKGASGCLTIAEKDIVVEVSRSHDE